MNIILKNGKYILDEESNLNYSDVEYEKIFVITTTKLISDILKQEVYVLKNPGQLFEIFSVAFNSQGIKSLDVINFNKIIKNKEDKSLDIQEDVDILEFIIQRNIKLSNELLFTYKGTLNMIPLIDKEYESKVLLELMNKETSKSAKNNSDNFFKAYDKERFISKLFELIEEIKKLVELEYKITFEDGNLTNEELENNNINLINGSFINSILWRNEMFIAIIQNFKTMDSKIWHSIVLEYGNTDEKINNLIVIKALKENSKSR